MSIIQRIRDKAAWFVFGAIALSLIAFILQDAFSRHGSLFSSGSSVGKVNGVTIEKDQYEKIVDLFEQSGNSQSRNQSMSQAWDYVVGQTVMQQQFDDLGIKVNSDELSDILFGDNPPPQMKQSFTNPQTGIYDADAAKQQFAQIKKNADDPKYTQLYETFLEPTMYQREVEKYQSLITGAVYIPKWMAEKTNADNNSVARISYVNVPYATVSDSAIKVSDDEIEGYIKKHAKQFEQKEEQRQISYVSFDANPSAEDTIDLKNQLEQLKTEFTTTSEEASFLSRNGTESPYYNSLIAKNAIQQPNKDSLFTMKQGEVYGPYLDNNDMVLAKLVEERQIPDSVKVRHILVATAQRTQNGQFVRTKDDSSALKRLDSAIALIKSGANFDSVCAQYSDDPGSKDKGGVYDYFPANGNMAEEFNDFAFTHGADQSGTVKTIFGYHYIEVLGQKGSTTGYKFAYLAKPIVASPETINSVSNAANQFSSSSRNKEQFEANAKKQNIPVQSSGFIKPNDFDIQGIGDNRTLVRWVYDNDPGDVSEPFSTDNKYIVAVITSASKPGLENATTARPMVEPLIRNEKKAQQIISTKLKGTTLEQYAQSAGTQVMNADSVSFQAYFIQNVGTEPKIIGAAFNKDLQGKVSAPIAGSSGVFVIKGESIYATSSLGANAEMVREQLATQMKQQIGYMSMSAIRTAADIEDNRSKFY